MENLTNGEHGYATSDLWEPHPTKPGKTLWDAREDTGVFQGAIDDEVLQMYDTQLAQADDVGISPLGSGSDYTVFLQRIGVRVTAHHD